MTDFSKGKRGAVISSDASKTRITIRLDQSIIDHYKGLVNAAGGGNYQTLINDVLLESIGSTDSLEKRLRLIVREEIREELKKAG